MSARRATHSTGTSDITLSAPAAAALFLCVLVVGCSNAERLRAAERSGAYVACQGFVETQLRAPATAAFPPQPEATIEPISQGDYEVTAYVDAQNTFGVPIRTPWTCVVKPDTNGRYRLLDLQMGDE